MARRTDRTVSQGSVRGGRTETGAKIPNNAGARSRLWRPLAYRKLRKRRKPQHIVVMVESDTHLRRLPMKVSTCRISRRPSGVRPRKCFSSSAATPKYRSMLEWAKPHSSRYLQYSLRTLNRFVAAVTLSSCDRHCGNDTP